MRKEQLFSCLRIASRLWGKGKRASSFRKGKKEILAIGYLTGSKSTRAEKAISRYIAISRRDRTRAMMTPPSLLWGPPTVFDHASMTRQHGLSGLCLRPASPEGALIRRIDHAPPKVIFGGSLGSRSGRYFFIDGFFSVVSVHPY